MSIWNMYSLNNFDIMDEDALEGISEEIVAKFSNDAWAKEYFTNNELIETDLKKSFKNKCSCEIYSLMRNGCLCGGC